MSKLTFHIDKNLSEKDRALVLSIIPEENKGPAAPLFAASLRKMAEPKERDAIEMLIREELNYRKKLLSKIPNESTTPLNVIHVAYPQSTPILKSLAGTGKLYFNQKGLICDFYSKVEFLATEEKDEFGTTKVIGKLRTGDREYLLQECDFICAGPPHWFIKGVVLRFISGDITWKEIKDILEGKAQPSQPDVDPLPILMLKDRTGAFADLWMAYGQEKIHYADHAKTKFIRKPNAEKAWEKDLLETAFIQKTVGNSRYYCPLDKVAKSLAFLLELGWSIFDFKGNKVLNHVKASLSIEEAGNKIRVRGNVKFDEFQANAADVIGAFTRRERFVNLGDGAVGLLPDQIEEIGLEGLQEETEIIGDTILVNRCRLAALPSTATVIGKGPLANVREKLQSFTGILKAPPEKTFLGTLRPYQQEGVNWLAFLYDYGFHGILADDMGLGKTVQVLAFLSRLDLSSPLLIVVPTSLIFNWKREIQRFLPTAALHIHHGSQRLDLPSSGIILTSYATLRLDESLFTGSLFQCVILDEAQAIKNAHTQIGQAVCRLQSRFRLSITGTPLENHLGELWSHFHFLMPELFGDEKAFEAELHAANADSRYLTRIKKKIRPFILRRKKEDVAKDLPDRIDQVIWIEMNASQRKVYEDFLSGVRGGLLKKVALDGMSKHRVEVLEAILRLRQICCHPLLVGIEESSIKLHALIEDLATIVEEGRKALVYSQFTGMLGLIAKEVREKNWRFAYLDGSTTNREKVVTQFQEDPEISLFLISLKAGGTGLNLTAADYVYLVDPWWNEAAEEQAINRAHRIGRHDTVIAKRYIVSDSIEDKIMKLKAHKRNLIDSIFDEKADPGFKEEDLLFLLGV